jgi:hypothetical protein
MAQKRHSLHWLRATRTALDVIETCRLKSLQTADRPPVFRAERPSRRRFAARSYGNLHALV